MVHLLSFFSSQPSAVTREVTQLKQPLILRKFLKDGPFVLSLKHKSTSLHKYPYISSSGTLVHTKFTATYVGMVVE